MRPTRIREYKMRTIHRITSVFVMLILGFCSVNAQSDYLLDYGPGSISWCWQMQQRENIIATQNAMMRAQILNYYTQQAAAATYHMITTPLQPMQGVMTYDGVYITPETVNSYHSEEVTCEHCDGGYNYRTVYMGGGETRKLKSRCVWCHGRGTVRRTVKN